ncbi:glutathione S-transferase family protein [Bordetella petrii]|uniref:Glutathione S-transferase family protein n=1 Tax=Bordetella petrii TaxID=94624 RepID=A0ABT7W0V9_9BORD|nr:glutathione S-transferase family protein [Bordetella petrii]MDM9558800.1 glutathione S-transferase family protein [Bordetella petrii]
MTPILFYGVPSGCSFGSIVALEWLGQPYRLCRIQMPEAVSGADFRRINPVAETPAYLSAAGDVITESMAILNHIGARGIAQGLGHPQGSRDFDRLNQMLAYLNTSFFNAFAPLWHVLEHDLESAAKTALAEYGRDKVEKTHATLDALLGDGPWLLGERRSVADAYFAGIARWADYHAVLDRRDYPNLSRLYDRLQADPAVAFAHGIEAGRAPASGGGYQGEIALADALALLPR